MVCAEERVRAFPTASFYTTVLNIEAERYGFCASQQEIQRQLTMKRRELKQWVVSKKKSFSEIFINGRPSEEGMEIDTPAEIDYEHPLPPKTIFMAKGNPFQVDSRYSYVKTLGVGAYGVVCAAEDSVLKEKVAVKKVAGVFNDLTDAKRIIRETRLLCSMNHENILRITDIDEPESYNQFNDVYIITELMDTDMNKLLRSSHPLMDAQRKYFTYQLLRAFKYIHRYVPSFLFYT